LVPIDRERTDNGVRSVRLTLDVIETLAHAPREMGVTEIAERLGVSKPSVFRHLTTLVDGGYLQQNAATSRYHWGPRLFLLGRIAPPRFDLAALAEPAMAELRDRLDQTVVLAAPAAAELVVLATVGSNKQIEIGVQRGSTLALHASAQGKIALAFGPEALRRNLEPALLPFTPSTITDIAVLDREVKQARERGWAMAPGEVMLGINALAVPVVDGAGTFVATLATVDLNDVITPEQAGPIQEAAARITRALLAAGGSIADDGR